MAASVCHKDVPCGSALHMTHYLGCQNSHSLWCLGEHTCLSERAEESQELCFKQIVYLSEVVAVIRNFLLVGLKVQQISFFVITQQTWGLDWNNLQLPWSFHIEREHKQSGLTECLNDSLICMYVGEPVWLFYRGVFPYVHGEVGSKYVKCNSRALGKDWQSP